MKTPREVEAPLSADDVRAILRICSPAGLLVGGQALAFWADHFDVTRPSGLASCITSDADFIGDSMLAIKLGKELGWTTWVPALDDATPQTGKVTRRLRDGSVKQVDFLSGVAGLTTKDLSRRAVEIEIDGIGSLRVMHPIDVLDSRIQNLHLLAEKRNAAGVAQAQLAVAAARAFVRNEVSIRGERVSLRLLERIVDIACDIAALRVFLLYRIDPLEAVPLDAFRTTSSLHRKRWPQVLAEVGSKRTTLRRAASQMTRPAR